MRIKQVLLALLLSLLVGKSFAVSFKVDGISYVANADTAIIKGYSAIPESGELTLASTVSYSGKDYRVTTVQSSAFLSCTELKKLIIPSTIKYIQACAFENCVNMTSLVLSEGEDRLDAASDAFKNCGIEEAVVGRNLKESVFRANGFLKQVSISNNIQEVPSRTFYGCSQLIKIDLGNVEHIGSYAFYGCSNLKNVNLSAVKVLEANAFVETGLESLEIPSQCLTIGERAFSDCGSLLKVSIRSELPCIPDYCFQNCTSLASVDYLPSVTTIGKSSFEGCAFASFDFLESVKIIGEAAFCNCKNLENVNWGGVNEIGDLSFAP